MAGLWHPDSPVMKKITFFTNLMLLNILWILCCVPVVTAGAATSAMYSVLAAYRKDQTDEVVQPFFAAFKLNFKQSTLLWVPTGLICGVLCFDALYLTANTDSNLGFVVIPMILITVLAAVILTYGFPQIALFENSLKMILRNSIYLFLLNPIRSLFMAMINLVPFLLLLVMPALFILLLPFWVLIGFSLGAYLNLRQILQIFDKYLQKEEQDTIDT